MSASAPDGPPVEDLTARARIRDAALRLFGDLGADNATVRQIARAAGVSGGLVRHHFGSKADLRAACDSYALNQLVRLKEQALREGRVAGPRFLSSVQPAMLVLFKYLARTMVDGSPVAGSMFDEMVKTAAAWLSEHHRGHVGDPEAYAALLVAMELGALTMHQQLSRSLGADIFEPEGHLRLARAKVDFYSQPLLSAELADRAHLSLDRLQKPPRASQTRNRPAPEEARR